MRQADDDGADERLMARERIRQAIARGDYAGLIAPGLQKVLEAAALAGDGGQGDAVAALRYAMYRLLAEEEDPRHLATNVTRVANALRLAEQARPGSGAGSDAIRVAMADQLVVLGLGSPGFRDPMVDGAVFEAAPAGLPDGSGDAWGAGSPDDDGGEW